MRKREHKRLGEGLSKIFRLVAEIEGKDDQDNIKLRRARNEIRKIRNLIDEWAEHKWTTALDERNVIWIDAEPARLAAA